MLVYVVTFEYSFYEVDYKDIEAVFHNEADAKAFIEKQKANGKSFGSWDISEFPLK